MPIAISFGGEPVLPGVSIGHNEYGAWGLTVFGQDNEDLYVYDTNPANPNQYRYLGRWENMTIIEDSVPVKGEAPVAVEGPLSGQTFVVTGTLAAFSRPEAEARVRALGGSTAASVTKATDYLVVGERPGSKLKKAQKTGTTILSEEAFMALLRQHGAL